MTRPLLLALAAGLLTAGAAGAQTPAINPMPDGSRDMFAGLGVQSAPRYEGASGRKVSALPVLQVQWSNGVFISGMTAGMHRSAAPTVEYGPLAAVLPGRDASGTGPVADGIGINSLGASPFRVRVAVDGERLTGIDEIGARLQLGGFYNVYLNREWRLAGSLLFGAARHHDGARLDLDLQRLAPPLGGRHHLSLAAGVSVVNRHYNESYFGVTEEEAARSRFGQYRPGAGVQDAHLGLRWNWTWSPSWILTSNVQARRLLGDARNSPLAERSTNLTVSTAVAYRF